MYKSLLRWYAQGNKIILVKKKRSGKQKRNTNNEIGSSDKANTCKIKRHNDFGNCDNSTVIVMTTIMITLSCWWCWVWWWRWWLWLSTPYDYQMEPPMARQTSRTPVLYINYVDDTPPCHRLNACSLIFDCLCLFEWSFFQPSRCSPIPSPSL